MPNFLENLKNLAERAGIQNASKMTAPEIFAAAAKSTTLVVVSVAATLLTLKYQGQDAFRIQPGTAPSAMVAATDTDGANVHFRMQDGGPADEENPSGGSAVFTVGSKGDGGTGIDGSLMAANASGAQIALLPGFGLDQCALVASGALVLTSLDAAGLLVKNSDLTLDFGDLTVETGNLKVVDGSLDFSTNLRLGYLSNGQGYFASTHAFNAEYRFLEFGDSEPANFQALADTAGKDAYFRMQSAGAHTSNNPRGGDAVWKLAAGSGTGRIGRLAVEETSGSDRVWLSHDGSNGQLGTDANNLDLINPTGSIRLRIGTSAITSFLPIIFSGANARDVGNTSGEARALYVGEDANSGVFWGLDQDARAYYDEATSDELKITTNASGKDISLEPASGSYVKIVSTKSTTGDPTGEEGMIYINTFDNVLKMYADGGWRTLASW
ncbi:MAG: hypothetical protein HS116_02220 [Planctomycetes bacterium]|nr:hypothetical protein [Planctomycetota bacterium]